MRRLSIGLVFIVGLCCSCCAQSSNKLVWKNFEFKDAGLQVSLPCEPIRTAKIFQEKPKVARLYSFACSKSDFDFAVSLPERFNDFDPEKVDAELIDAEQTLRVMIDDKAAIGGQSLVIQGLSAREFSVKNDWTIGRQTAIVHERGIYNVRLSFTAPNEATLNNQQIDEFELVATKFFASFQLIK